MTNYHQRGVSQCTGNRADCAAKVLLRVMEEVASSRPSQAEMTEMAGLHYSQALPQQSAFDARSIESP